MEVVLAGRHRAHVGHGQDLLVDGLPGGVGGGHRHGRRGLVHAQEFTWKDTRRKKRQSGLIASVPVGVEKRGTTGRLFFFHQILRALFFNNPVKGWLRTKG